MSLHNSLAVRVDDEKLEIATSRRGPPAIRWVLVILKFLIGQWQVLGIGVAVLFAWAFPNVGRRGGVIESQYSLSWLDRVNG